MPGFPTETVGTPTSRGKPAATRTKAGTGNRTPKSQVPRPGRGRRGERHRHLGRPAARLRQGGPDGVELRRLLRDDLPLREDHSAPRSGAHQVRAVVGTGDVEQTGED
jgi:hypothetical protein